MKTLAEVEDAVHSLTIEEQHRLLIFILDEFSRNSEVMSHPRRFSKEQLQRWIEADERGMQEFLRLDDATLPR